MSFTQVISFDTAKGGNIPNLCLANVCKGYRIANKYGSAWEAWENTQQHPDRNIPDGLDVPLYYSYTTTIDGVTQNYGHINVRLKNGTVWSDGKTYNSINDYTANHSPKYVGWGESINDVKVIGGEMKDYPTKGDLVNIHNNQAWPGHDINDNDVAFWCNGTENPAWGDVNNVWVALVNEVTNYAKAHPDGFTPVTEQLYKKEN